MDLKSFAEIVMKHVREYVQPAIDELAERINPIVRGWMNYYGRFFRSELLPLLKRINGYLVRWARKKYRRLAPFKRVKRWWDRLVSRNRRLFAHWQWPLR